MVQLEEVRDEEFDKPQPGPDIKDDEDDWDTDSDSEISDVESQGDLDESLFDRLAALKDIVPPTYRDRVASVSSTGYSWASRALSFGGKSLWVVSTSVLLMGVPWALAFSEEQQVQEMEREMRMQQSANELMTRSPTEARPAL